MEKKAKKASHRAWEGICNMHILTNDSYPEYFLKTYSKEEKKDSNRHFTKEDIWMVNKLTKKMFNLNLLN